MEEVSKLLGYLELPTIKKDIYNKICDKLCMIHYNSGQKEKSLEFLAKKKDKTHLDYNNIANIFFEIHHYQECCKYFETSLNLQYDIDIAYKLACIYNQLGNMFQSYRTYKNILTLEPDHIKSINNMAEIKMVTLRQNEAIEDYKRAFELENRFSIYSNIIMNSYYNGSQKNLVEKYSELISTKIKISLNTRIPCNKIKIGYISQEFLTSDENKPVNCFVKHIFENHSDKFEVYCYYVHRNRLLVKENTSMYTESIERVISRNLTGISINEIVNKIKDDNLHILVELMNHTSGNVLEVLQYKPAPLQISYCSFPGTTGLKNIDYKILDNVTNKNTDYYSEKIVCMPKGFHCFRPNYEFPKPIEIKQYENQLKTRSINLCSFANPKKLNSNVIETWSKLLKKENKSEIKLYLRHSSYSSSFVRKCIQLEFEKHEIEDKIIFVGNFPDYLNALNFYNSMDIFLDTFPYNGTTTICEALLMNVPVITLEGETVESRIGSSLLHQCGLEEFICRSEEEYTSSLDSVQRSVILSQAELEKKYIEKVNILMNKKELVKVREIIRDKIGSSYLMNSKDFVLDYEETLKRLL